MPYTAGSPFDITQPGDPVKGIPDDNDWPPNQAPLYGIDNNINTKYLHFRSPGETTGLCVTPSLSSTPVAGFTVITAEDVPDRDPVSFILYGSNTSIDGPYTVIATGTIDELNQPAAFPRNSKIAPILFSNEIIYNHYQILFPDVRNNNAANSMQIAELELLANPEGWPPIVDAGPSQMLILPRDRVILQPDIQLFGSIVIDDVDFEWQLESGPDGISTEAVIFEPNQYTFSPQVTFPAAGMYVLSLTASTPLHAVSDTIVTIVSESLCPPADLNGDCRVDTADLLIIAEAWLNTQTILPPPDLDDENDGVGLSDFAVLAENWALQGPSVVISEFMAVNSAKYPPGENEILDEDNDSSDWIELCNVTDQPINLQGWYLTDDETDLTQWPFPELILQPEEFCIIFASAKDRQTPGDPLHTNFGLSSDPEFLAMVGPDGQTIVHHYNEYPPQYGLLSYGLASPDVQPTETVQLVAPNDPAVAHLPTNDSLSLSWTAVDFNPIGWLTGTTGIGYERDSNPTTSYTPWTGLDVGSMYGTGSTAYIRIPFEVDDLTGLRNLVFSIMYDDGFVAYLNGTQIAAANAPAVPVWNSSATTKHNDYDALQYVSFPLSDDVLGYLRKGTNVLAIHGLNENNTSSDFLILPRLNVLRDQSISIVSLVEAYFPNPTPGTQNGTGQMNLGPLVRDVTTNPIPPSAAEDLVITAEITQTRRPVSRADMVYRIGFGEEVTVAMQDDGQAADAAAQDSTFTAVIPASAYAPGDMIRWYVRAFDSQDIETRAPLFLLEENSPRYFGTVAVNPAIQTNLPVFQYFLQDLAAAAVIDGTGTRCSVFYLNEFYDNVLIRRRGGFSTNGRKFEFNDGHHFLFDPQYARVDEINLNEKGFDPTYIRPLLSFPTYTQAGVPGSLVAPWHVIRNNNYLDVRIFVEQPDKDFLRREGLDVNGAFYKVYSDLNAELTGDEQIERKKTRLDEDNSDYIALRMGIASANPDRNIYLFDNVNVPAVISYMAASVLVHENDHTHKNYYLYRDTENTGEWMFIPWDKDLTFGLNYGISGIIADYDKPEDPLISPSHPFYGTYYHRKIHGNWNRLFDAIISDSVARQMYLRRLRTLMDTFLQPPGTPANELLYENQIDEWTDSLANELNSSDYLNNINLMKTQYLQVRRHHLYVNHLHGSAWPDDPAQIPDAQPAQFSLQIGQVDFNPVSWNQDEEYIEIINPNAFAADISGWTVEDAVEHTFPGGTVIPAGGSLYLTPNALAFRNRATAPTGGQHLFVQGNYKGHLYNWGETITIYDTQRNVAVSQSYIGNPTDAQRYLRITEIMYHPLDTDNPVYPDEDYEYLELTNIAAAPLSLDGIAFTEGINYQFPAGLQLGAGEYLLLAKNPAAFTLRYTVPQGTQVLGGYDGNLSNSGETLKLEDHTHSTVLEFAYNDKWYDITDGLGFSLVFWGDLHAAPDTWDNQASWRASLFIGGSPGTAEQGLAANNIVFSELLAHSHGTNDWIELFNKTDLDINISGWFLTDDNSDLNTIRKYEIPADTILPKNGYLLFSQGTSFGSPSQPLENRFALSEGGETVYLYSGLNGEVTGYYYTDQKFEASETGVTLGRFEKASLSGGYNFVPMITPTPLAANSGPRIPDVVITEMMVDPPAGADDEYLELLNRSGSFVTLMTLADTEMTEGVTTTEWLPWQIDGIGYIFAENVVLAPNERIIVAKNLTAFDAAYGLILPEGTRVLGPYSGKLNNGGENIELQIPGDQEWGKDRIYIPIEKIEYSNEAPWLEELDSGDSLTRINADAYADDPENWQTATPSPGQ